MNFDEKLDISALINASKAYSKPVSEAGELDEKFYETYRSAMIKHFEVCFELCWKFMQRWLKYEELAAFEASYSKKDIFRLAHRKGLISDAMLWFEYLDIRNRTAHTYDEKTAEEVFSMSKKFFHDFKRFIVEMEKRI